MYGVMSRSDSQATIKYQNVLLKLCMLVFLHPRSMSKVERGWKETLIVYEHTLRLRTAKGSKVVQGELPHIPS